PAARRARGERHRRLRGGGGGPGRRVRGLATHSAAPVGVAGPARPGRSASVRRGATHRRADLGCHPRPGGCAARRRFPHARSDRSNAVNRSRITSVVAGVALVAAAASACSSSNNKGGDGSSGSGASGGSTKYTFGLANQQESVTFPAAIAK